ncbi:Hypothetical protein HVR_LOCUS648 [uncultured virus]|nr:Hypothetical protein HVR_LOCUS648 [uncultured virus]
MIPLYIKAYENGKIIEEYVTNCEDVRDARNKGLLEISDNLRKYHPKLLADDVYPMHFEYIKIFETHNRIILFCPKVDVLIYFDDPDKSISHSSKILDLSKISNLPNPSDSSKAASLHHISDRCRIIGLIAFTIFTSLIIYYKEVINNYLTQY